MTTQRPDAAPGAQTLDALTHRPSPHSQAARSFGSDNHAGVHPEIMAAIASANIGDAPAYGTDAWTEEARRVLEHHVGPAAVHFVFNGTGANVIALAALAPPDQAIFCSDVAHVSVDECAAPERFTGCKLITLRSEHGKISPSTLENALVRRGDQHFAQAGVLTLTQPTEYGTCYTLSEQRELMSIARRHGLRIHIDGARLVNAAVTLSASLSELTAGADIVSLGGTKNGLMFGEALVCPKSSPVYSSVQRQLRYLVKQAMQLSSKNRYVAAQFIAWLGSDLWRRSASHATALAQRLAEEASAIPGVTLTHPVESNAVFALLPKAAAKRLKEAYFFYEWDEHTGEVRWMCHSGTRAQDVEDFLVHLKAALQVAPGSTL